MEAMQKVVKGQNVRPEHVNDYLEKIGTSPIQFPERIARLALRPEVSLPELLTLAGVEDEVVVQDTGLERIASMVEIDLKYAGYLERENEMINKMIELEKWRIPQGFNYHEVTNITMEAREKLSKIQPDTLGQASRISGVSPADVSVLMVMLKKQGRKG